MENPPEILRNTQIFPNDIIAKICISLPAKSVGRFRGVSKFWRSHLSEHTFIKTHLNRIKNLPNEDEEQVPLMLVSQDAALLFRMYLNNAHQLFDEMTTTVSATEITFDKHPFKRKFCSYSLASCDGLVLVGDEDKKLFVINPTTRWIRDLPDSPYALDPDDVTLYGFGFDSANDDYKVVRISYDDGRHLYEPNSTPMFVDVYSLRNGAWKRVENSPYDHGSGDHGTGTGNTGYGMSGVLVNGFIHWLACKDTVESSFIVAFDFGSEKFHEVPPPSALEDEDVYFVRYKLVAIGGCLCLYPKDHMHKSYFWVMKEYGVKESWTYIPIIDTSSVDYNLLCGLGKEHMALAVHSRSDDNKLAVYNMKDGSKLTDIVVQGISDGVRVQVRLRAGVNYLETLVLPHYAT